MNVTVMVILLTRVKDIGKNILDKSVVRSHSQYERFQKYQ